MTPRAEPIFTKETKVAVSILVVALLALLIVWSPLIRLAAFGETVGGEVLHAESTIFGTDQDQIIHQRTVTYTFTPRGGEALRLEEPVSEPLFARLSPGDEVSVRYLPHDPHRAMIEGNFLKVVQTSTLRVFLTLVILAALLAAVSNTHLFRDLKPAVDTPESPTLNLSA